VTVHRGAITLTIEPESALEYYLGVTRTPLSYAPSDRSLTLQQTSDKEPSYASMVLTVLLGDDNLILSLRPLTGDGDMIQSVSFQYADEIRRDASIATMFNVLVTTDKGEKRVFPCRRWFENRRFSQGTLVPRSSLTYRIRQQRHSILVLGPRPHHQQCSHLASG
jgi:hypothetical protein